MSVVAMLPGVLECAVIGRTRRALRRKFPSSLSGRGTLLSPKRTSASTARANLTGYKRPKYIEFRKELPKTNVGKILRPPARGKKAASS